MIKENLTFILLVIIILLFIATILYLIWFTLKLSSQTKNKVEKSYSSFDAYRLMYEKQIYDLTDKLTSTEKAWKDINHLLLNKQLEKTQSRLPERISNNQFFESFGINEKDTQVHQNEIFVLCPFNPIFDNIYTVVRDTCITNNFRCYRGDESNQNGEIFSHILKCMLRANLIIALIDGRNPNVFYELGIAHALDKPVILISKDRENLSFDIQGKKALLYNDQEELRTKLNQELQGLKHNKYKIHKFQS